MIQSKHTLQYCQWMWNNIFDILCYGGKHVTLCEHQEKVTIYFFLVQKEILTLKTIVKEKNICWFDDLTSSGMNATSQQKQFYFVLSAVIS